ncbi:MAG TPA: hypothetical protein EYQ81_09320, partial [Sneathiellales bacterium]|nr:hypothetical protein [Sneathiellales bacterium]
MSIQIDPNTGLKIFNTRASIANDKITGKGYSVIEDEALTTLPPAPPGAAFNAEEQAQYRKLSAQFKVTGVPTIILADDQGRPYHRQVGYSGDPPDKYVADLKQKSTILAKRNEFLAKADQAEGVERAKLLDQAIGLIDNELAMSTYIDTVEEIIK